MLESAATNLTSPLFTGRVSIYRNCESPPFDYTRIMSSNIRLPPKMRLKNSNNLFGEYQDDSSTSSASPHPSQPQSPADMQYDPCSPMYSSPDGLIDLTSSANEECAMAISPAPPHSSSNTIPDVLSSYLPPEHVLPSQRDSYDESQPSTSAGAARKDSSKSEKEFIYYIDGRPIDLEGNLSSMSSRVRSNCGSRGSGQSSSSSSSMMSQYYSQPGPSRAPHPGFYHQQSYDPYDPHLPATPMHPGSLFQSRTSAFGPVDHSSRDFGPGMMGCPPGGMNAASPVKKKKLQECRLCANHGVEVYVKGHRPFCKYKTCMCEKCKITKDRRVAVKKQAKLTREQDAEKKIRDQGNDHYFPPGSGFHPGGMGGL